MKKIIFLFFIISCQSQKTTKKFEINLKKAREYVHIYYTLEKSNYRLNKVDSIGDFQILYLVNDTLKKYKVITKEKKFHKDSSYVFELETILTKGWKDKKSKTLHIYNHSKDCQVFNDSVKICLEDDIRELHRIITPVFYD